MTHQDSTDIHYFKRIVIVAVVLGLMTLLRYSSLLSHSDPAVFSVTLLGFMLVLSFNLGKILSRFKLPKLTIYLITGILCGPYLGGFVSQKVVQNLKFVDDLALGMIAFIAGGEMRFGQLKRLWKVLFSISAAESGLVFLSVTGVFLALSPWMGFTEGRGIFFSLTAAVLAGAILIANSPTVTIGIIGEYRTHGKLTDTVLGTVVVKDVILLVFFAFVSSTAAVFWVPGATFGISSFISNLGREIFGSIAVGVAVGFLIWLYLKFIGEQTILFVLGMAFMCHELAHQFHMEVLLMGVSAGFCVQNFSRAGEKLIENVEASLPIIYPVFFSIAGAKLNLPILKDMWYVALALAAVRGAGVFYGARLGAKWSDAPPEVRQFAWMGLLSQAGVALGLTVIVERTFPGWGGAMGTFIIPVIGLNELVGPICFKYALDRCGEIPQEGRETAAVFRD